MKERRRYCNRYPFCLYNTLLVIHVSLARSRSFGQPREIYSRARLTFLSRFFSASYFPRLTPSLVCRESMSTACLSTLVSFAPFAGNEFGLYTKMARISVG